MAVVKKTVKTSRKQSDKLKRSAYEMVVIQCKDQKEVAQILNLSQVTISKWAVDGNWKKDRESRQRCHSTDADNTKQILRLLSKKRLELEFEIQDAETNGDKEQELMLRKEAHLLSDEISKQNKTLLNLDKENRITLGVYLDVMDDIFNSLQQFDQDLWMKTINFQEAQIRKATNLLA